VHVAWQSAEATTVISVEFTKGEHARAEEEQIATQHVLDAVAEACGIESGTPGAESEKKEGVQRREVRAPRTWSELLLGEKDSVEIEESAEPANTNPQSARSSPAVAGNPKSKLLFPGAFNPIHAGHERMAAIAAERCAAPVTWELSIANVDKPPLDFIEISDRLAGLAGRRVLLTRAATFVEKAALAPACTFIVGADTMERIGDCRYYEGDIAKRDAAIAAIATRSCRFLVFGRSVGGRFRTLRDLELPPTLGKLCDEVSESDFRNDEKSSEIRSESRSNPRDA
jgi:hypothetical protein